MTGDELKIWRKGRKLTQVELAKRLGVSQEFLSMIENGGKTGKMVPPSLEAKLTGPGSAKRRVRERGQK